MPLPDDVWCFLVGENLTFSVNINKSRTQTVDHLKHAIKVILASALDTVDAPALTLYLVNAIGSDGQGCTEVAEHKAQDLSNLRKLDPFALLTDIFAPPGPSGPLIHILVQPPRVAKRTASEPLVESETRRANIGPPPGFSVLKNTNAPLARLCRSFWGQEGKIEDLKSGMPKEFNCEQLDQTGYRLYFFNQYQYMQQRVDAIRNKGDTRQPRDCVVVIGTPGIGKTTFLHYYLALQLAQKQVTMFCNNGELYIFEGENTIYYADVSAIELEERYFAAPCLLNSETNGHPPRKLTQNRRLFILQAASPNPIHTEWTEKRNNVCKFVLNPPDEQEITAALLLHKISLSPRSIQNSLRRYGCNMRTLYEVLVRDQEAAIVEHLRKKIKNYSFSDIHKMLVSGHAVSDRTSHSIVTTMCKNQPQPGESAYTRSDEVTHNVSAPAVWDALRAEHAVAHYSQITKNITVYQRVPDAASAAGRMWETHCHSRIYMGGSYTLIRMIAKGGNLVPSRNEKEPIKIERMNPNELKIVNPSHLTFNPDEYYIPEAKNNQTFDSFFFLGQKQIAIQITLSPSRTPKPGGFTVLENLQPKSNYELYFIFVVPTSSAENFKCKVPANVQDKFDFFLLEMKQDYFMIPSDGVNATVEGEEKGLDCGKGPSVGRPKRKREDEGAGDPVFTRVKKANRRAKKK